MKECTVNQLPSYQAFFCLKSFLLFRRGKIFFSFLLMCTVFLRDLILHKKTKQQKKGDCLKSNQVKKKKKKANEVSSL